MMTADVRILHPCDTEDAQAVRRQNRAMRELDAQVFPEPEAGRGRTSACSAALPSFYAAVSVAKTTTFPW